LGLNTKLHKKSKLIMKQAAIPNIKVAEEFDWRDHNAVTPVKNQVLIISILKLKNINHLNQMNRVNVDLAGHSR
jgi:C1A family cysteine protease